MARGANRFSALGGFSSSDRVDFLGSSFQSQRAVGAYEVHNFNTTDPVQNESYEKLMTEIMLNVPVYRHIRRETHDFDNNRYIRVEFFKLAGKKREEIKIDVKYSGIAKDIEEMILDNKEKNKNKPEEEVDNAENDKA